MDGIAVSSKRRLLLRDGMTFLALTLVTVVLFVLTLLLFRSFTGHRGELATRWAGRGQAALAEGRPQDAVEALRTALSYAPDEHGYELILAQALAASGHVEEATNYFLNLWEAQPGDGVINLGLARLMRRKGDRNQAVRYYRAAVDGSWEGDGVVRRRDARLELANYLIDQRDFATAQTELLIAGSNAPTNAGLEVGLGDALVRAQDPADALKYYQKAIARAPRDAVAYDRAGRLAYRMGDYAKARGWLEKAVRESAGGLATSRSGEGADGEDETLTLLKKADRLVVLDPGGARTARERIARELTARGIAKKRFDVCAARLGGVSPLPREMQALSVRWAAASGLTTARVLAADDANEDAVTGLVDDTEKTAAAVCGAPAGDDALLLLLAEQRR